MPSDKPLKIVILGLNYTPELVGVAIYTTGLAEGLARRGHDVHVVAGKPYYPSWKVEKSFRGRWIRQTKENEVKITRLAHYVPKRPSGFRRLVHHLSFAASCLIPFVIVAFKRRPDVIFTVAPSLVASPIALVAARLVGASTWLHIQDFEVEAAMATGLVRRAGVWAKLGRWGETFLLRRFDRVSTISEAMCRKCAEKGVKSDRIYEFRNWADIESVKPLDGPSIYRTEWEISTRHVALYSGNIANKQGIEIIVSAARRLKCRSDLTFVICGEGPNLDNLKLQAAGLSNIQFRPLQPKERLGDLVGLATLHLLPQLASAADLVLPSKLANMLASGRPVVATALPGSGLAHEVGECGLIVRPEDEDAFVDAIERLLNDDDWVAYGKAARARAEERWDRESIITKLERQLLLARDAPVR